jgi:hypothetical protein
MMTIDIVVHIRSHEGRRRISGIEFEPGRSLGGQQRTGSGQAERRGGACSPDWN